MGFTYGFTSTLNRVAAVLISILLLLIITVSPKSTVDIITTTQNHNEFISDYSLLIQQGVNLSAVMSIFAPVSDQVQNEQCRKDSHIFLRELHRFTLWATQSKYYYNIVLCVKIVKTFSREINSNTNSQFYRLKT
jgi:hypothetical protein